ncbi:MAG: 4-(cytidine 5'-diphospho)-2-C-methyl-D-erythritol kinase [Elusimicrobia bacterium]|nr:4-(cytidine 5'-diphospho)-2-C-methyl-D-erythritol kinase [Elusimicrobiota bacterium]
MKVLSPAKINLFLEITGRRPDGYHEIATLFAKVGLYDELEFHVAQGSQVRLKIKNMTTDSLLPDSHNLVLRAAEAFREAFGIRQGLAIGLIKRIPLGAGLGGGSSNAGITLRCLSRLFKLPLNSKTHQKMKILATKLGADVPLFLKENSFYTGRGVGDLLEPFRVKKMPYWALLVFPGFPSATAEAYRRLKIPPRQVVLTSLSNLHKLKRNLLLGSSILYWGNLLFNRLEEVVFSAHPVVHQIKDALLSCGAPGALMSGSGSSVFGLVRSREEGEKILHFISTHDLRAFLVPILT